MKKFMHYVHANQPFVVRGAVQKMGLVDRWTDEYLAKAIGRQVVNVRLSKYNVRFRCVWQTESDLRLLLLCRTTSFITMQKID